MSTFSFTNFSANPATSNAGGTGGGFTRTQERKPSDKQVQYYIDLCVQRKAKPQDYTKMSAQQLSDVIEELRKWYPASDKQKQLVVDITARLNELGVNIKPHTQEFLDGLTGGANGTASAIINTLMQKEKEMGDIAPPTDQQLGWMVSMFLCADIPFEDHGVERKIFMDEWIEKKDGTRVQAWRYPTPDEFAQMCKEAFVRKEANKFIDDWRGTFHGWKQTRITMEQEKHIRELESRLSNTYTPPEVEWAIVDGELKQVTKPSIKQQYAPSGYVPMDEMQIKMLSKEQASEMLDRLKYEIEAKELYRFEAETMQDDDNESLRKASTQNDRKVKEFTLINDLIYKMEAVGGIEVDRLHDEAVQVLFEEVDDTRIKQVKQSIKDFMMELINEDYISYQGMIQMIGDSDMGLEILMGNF